MTGSAGAWSKASATAQSYCLSPTALAALPYGHLGPRPVSLWGLHGHSGEEMGQIVRALAAVILPKGVHSPSAPTVLASHTSPDIPGDRLQPPAAVSEQRAHRRDRWAFQKPPRRITAAGEAEKGAGNAAVSLREGRFAARLDPGPWFDVGHRRPGHLSQV